MMEHHTLDPYPIPRDKKALYINEPWLVDRSLLEYPPHINPEEEEDNVRIYVPIDLNRTSILRRLSEIIARYGESSERNELDYMVAVNMIISQLEIYDQVWYVRHMPEEGNHSTEATELARDIVMYLESIPDGGAERFPFDMIEELKQEFGLD